MTWVPRACTLPTPQQPLRVAEFDELFADATQPADRLTPTRLRLHLPAGEPTVSTVRDLVARETGCCSFFFFELRETPVATELEVRVPHSQIAVLDAMQQRTQAARSIGSGG